MLSTAFLAAVGCMICLWVVIWGVLFLFFSGRGLSCLPNLCFRSSFHLLCMLQECEGVTILVELLVLGCGGVT